MIETNQLTIPDEIWLWENKYSSSTNTQPFSQTGQMIELCCEYLSVWYILTVCSLSHMHFRVNPHFIVAWMTKNSLLEAGTKLEVSVTTTGLKPTST